MLLCLWPQDIAEIVASVLMDLQARLMEVTRDSDATHRNHVILILDKVCFGNYKLHYEKV